MNQSHIDFSKVCNSTKLNFPGWHRLKVFLCHCYDTSYSHFSQVAYFCSSLSKKNIEFPSWHNCGFFVPDLRVLLIERRRSSLLILYSKPHVNFFPWTSNFDYTLFKNYVHSLCRNDKLSPPHPSLHRVRFPHLAKTVG